MNQDATIADTLPTAETRGGCSLQRLVMPDVVSFSGGQTSGLMLWRLRHKENLIVLFCNTGKEHAKTLDFVRDVEANWGIEIVWLEYCRKDDKPSFRVVTYDTASRNGEPFDELMGTLNRVPNVCLRACSSRLKDRVMKRYLKAMGYETWHSYVGIRADEAHRTTEILAQSPNYITQHFPLVDEGVTKEQVNDWWDAQPFKLNIPNHKGNCDLCFLKAKWKLLSIMRENPDSAAWWISWEKKMASKGITGEGTRWRYGTSYESMLADATHPELPLDFSEEDIPCSCAAGAARDDEQEA